MQLGDVRDWCQYFYLEHSPAYQKIQCQFWDSVETFDPNAIAVSITQTSRIILASHFPFLLCTMCLLSRPPFPSSFTLPLSLSSLPLPPLFFLQAILHAHPYHIDSLLQMSEVAKMGEDIQTATELIGQSQ